jgi:cation diffusion facilitator family transporter
MPDTSQSNHNQQDILAASAARGIRATAWGIVASTCLAVVKVVGGIVGNSYALVADGVESMLDIMSSMVVWGSLRIASQPATERYPYGYGKAEPLAALAVATALLGAAVGISIQSIAEIRTPHHMPAPFTLWVLVGVIASKEVMFRYLFRTGEAIGSKAMQTDAWHHRSDSLTSVAAFIGISVALYMGEGYESADDWAALFAACVIAFNGVRLFRSALRDVLDISAPPALLSKVRGLACAVPGVIDVEKCRIRASGLVYFIDLHVIVDGGLTVHQGHEISHRVKDVLVGGNMGIQDVTIHIEPGRASVENS